MQAVIHAVIQAVTAVKGRTVIRVDQQSSDLSISPLEQKGSPRTIMAAAVPVTRAGLYCLNTGQVSDKAVITVSKPPAINETISSHSHKGSHQRLIPEPEISASGRRERPRSGHLES